MRVYILGPMTGIKDDNRPAFRKAAETLRKMGAEVVSPDELDLLDPLPEGTRTWADYLRRDLPWVVQAEAGAALPGWRNSKGATLEATILNALGRPVFELRGEQLVQVEPEALPRPSYSTTL